MMSLTLSFWNGKCPIISVSLSIKYYFDFIFDIGKPISKLISEFKNYWDLANGKSSMGDLSDNFFCLKKYIFNKSAQFFKYLLIIYFAHFLWYWFILNIFLWLSSEEYRECIFHFEQVTSPTSYLNLRPFYSKAQKFPRQIVHKLIATLEFGRTTIFLLIEI